jgi:DNA topoisomerase I
MSDPLPRGLVYVSDAAPGIRRVRRGSGFAYRDPQGRWLRDRATLQRIRTLAVPPAYESVWICTRPDGHLQATARDARGRKQYRYHPEFRALREATKFDRMAAFGRVLPRARAQVRRDLARAPASGPPPQPVVLATIVQLLDATFVRVGNDEYARSNHSYGLTTLRDQHVAVRGSELRFEFRGKSGQLLRCRLRDRRVARILAHCQALPGAELFQYVGERGRRRRVASADVNDFLRSAIGEEFSAKDFRTWTGSLVFLSALRATRGARGRRSRREVLAALDEAAARLQNTRAVCRSAYVHPALVTAFERGAFAGTPARRPVRGLSADERVLLGFLERLQRGSALSPRTSPASRARPSTAAPPRPSPTAPVPSPARRRRCPGRSRSRPALLPGRRGRCTCTRPRRARWSRRSRG